MRRRRTSKRTPYRRGRRPSFRRYKKMRSRRRNYASRVLVRGPYICPDMYFCKLVYNDTFTIAPGVSYYNQLFHGNSVYDPDYTGTGGQPLGYDQLVAFYQRFTVLGVKIHVTIMPTSVSGNSDQQLTIHASNSNTTYTDADLISSQPYAKTRYIGNGNTGPYTLSAYYSTAKILGVSKQKLNSDDVFSGAYNQNPTQKFYINTFMADLTSDAVVATMKVRLTYYTKFWDRFPLNAS